MRDYMKLTNTQEEIIRVLVDLNKKTGRAVRCNEVAECIQRSPGTVRNLLQLLKSIKLVKSVPGPKGGYFPTGLAHETLSFSQETDPIPVYLNNRLSSVTLQELKFKPPNSGIFRVSGDIRDFKTGDRINISSEKLLVCGRVIGRDDMSNSLLSSIEVAFLRE